MAATSVLKKLGDKAFNTVNTLKAIPPGENEAAGIRAVQENVDQAAQYAQKPVVTKEEVPVNAPVDRMHPMARYGDAPGEHRIDTSSMLKPLGSTVPTYDEGGDVKPGFLTPIGSGKYGHIAYDEGGDVDVNDGQHQLAVLKDGERVLTPEEAEEYKKEHGAPASFGGRVISNPKGLKPILDTEAQPRTDEPMGGGKMNTENAPLETPKGDISNPTAAEMGGATPTEAGTKELRPYGEFKSEKEKAKEKVEHPGVQTTTSELPGEEIKPRGGTPAEQQAIDTDIKSGMGQGVNGLTKIGLAKIHERMLAPAGLNQGAPGPVVGETTPTAPGQPGLKPIGGTALTTAVPMDRKATIADYDKRIQEALNQATPEGGETAARLAQAKQNYIDKNPAHPGLLGKIGRVASKIGNIAGDIVAPGVMSLIPGTDINKAVGRANLSGQIDTATKQATERDIAEGKADKAAREGTPEQQLIIANQALRKAQAMGEPTAIAQAQGKVEDIESAINAKNVQPKAGTGEQNKEDFQKTLAKIGTPEAADPGKQMDALSAARDSKVISDDEYKRAVGYLGANPAPATQMTAAGEKSDMAAKAKRAGKWYTWTDDSGTHYGSGDKVPENAEPSEVDGKTFMNEARVGNIVQKSLNQVAQDVDKHPEIWDNAAARAILATTLEQVDRTSAGLLIAGTGGNIPLPSGIGDMINTALQNKALDKKTSEAIKDYIADYKSMKDKVIAMQMEMQGGKIGRGSAQAFKAIADQLPNGATPDSKTAQRQMRNLFTTQQDLMGKFPERYQNYSKEPPYAFSAGTAPTGATHEVVQNNKVVGHVVNGKYVPLKETTETK